MCLWNINAPGGNKFCIRQNLHDLYFDLTDHPNIVWYDANKICQKTMTLNGGQLSQNSSQG